MNMSILAALPGFALAFILIFCYEYRIKLIKTKPKNKAHFYVARDKNGDLWLYIGKPVRTIDEFHEGNYDQFLACNYGKVIVSSKYFSKYGLNENDYDNLKWEDEPVEVSLNLE